MTNSNFFGSNYQGNSFSLYSEEINKYDLLDKEKEIELAKRIEIGDMDARNEFINANLKLVVKIAKSYDSLRTDLNDRIQDGNMGLMIAVDYFDYRKGNRFSTYAVPWIRKCILKGYNNTSRTIRLPEQICDELSKLNKTIKTLTANLGGEPTVSEIAKELGYSNEKVETLLSYNESPISLDKQLDDEDESFNLMNTIEDKEENTVNSYEINDRNSILHDCINELNEAEQKIIYYSFGFDGNKYTNDEICEKVHLSRETVRKMKKSAIDKLRVSCKEMNLDIYAQKLAG